MSCVLRSHHRVSPHCFLWLKSNQICSQSSNGESLTGHNDVFEEPIEIFLKHSKETLDSELSSDDWHDSASMEEEGCGETHRFQRKLSTRRAFVENTKRDADRVFEALKQDGPGFDVRSALTDLHLSLSGLLTREVLLRILRIMNHTDKTLCAKMGYKFFLWSAQQNHGHALMVDSYHLLMNIFAQAEEFRAMWRLVDEMIQKGYPVTARTLNILLSTCAKTELAKDVVERFVKSKSFNYRPFKHSYNAVLYALLAMKQYKLIEWVHEQMLAEGYVPDALTYNVVMWAKDKLEKFDQLQRLFNEMVKKGHSPDVHTFNILLHFLGKVGKPLSAREVFNQMRELGLCPSVLHYTTLIDGLSRARDMVACRFFFDEMVKNGCEPDVVCYTVMITGYGLSGEMEKARELFDDMVSKGKLPNVFTYNSMIRGLCIAGRFEDARVMLKEMEEKGCQPNFLVYNTLVSNLRSAGKVHEAHNVEKEMTDRGMNVHLLSKVKKYRNC